jgi:hypothetical protein
MTVGYPLAELHPNVGRWHAGLAARPEFSRELQTPLPLRVVGGLVRLRARLMGKSLRQVAGF